MVAHCGQRASCRGLIVLWLLRLRERDLECRRLGWGMTKVRDLMLWQQGHGDFPRCCRCDLCCGEVSRGTVIRLQIDHDGSLDAADLVV